MGKFWFLLTIAFVDLALALVLASRGYGPEAWLFVLIAGILGGYAFLSAPSVQRDPRGRLQPAEVPYGGVLGTVGAIVILCSAGYVAFSTTQLGQPAGSVAPVHVEAPRSAPVPQAYAPPRSYRPAASGAALYKCVDPSGQASYQSGPCPPGSRQDWVRDATPEPEPTPAQRRLLARQREASRQRQVQSPSYSHSPGGARQSANPESSAACQAARAADAAYRRRPLKQVTHDGLRQHGDRIRAACN